MQMKITMPITLRAIKRRREKLVSSTSTVSGLIHPLMTTSRAWNGGAPETDFPNRLIVSLSAREAHFHPGKTTSPGPGAPSLQAGRKNAATKMQSPRTRRTNAIQNLLSLPPRCGISVSRSNPHRAQEPIPAEKSMIADEFAGV